MNKPKVLIVDFGSQYSRIISKKTRQLGVYSEIINPCAENLISIAKDSDAIILSGGPSCVEDDGHIQITPEIFSINKPILGICYGMQLTQKNFGGSIDTKNFSEFGYCELIKEHEHPLIDNVPNKSKIWCSHNDYVVKLGRGFKSIAKTDKCISIAVHDEKQIYTVQFHPEISQCEYGQLILSNFLFKLANIKPARKTGDILHNKIQEIKKIVGSSKVLLALSGGVDSSVLSYLLLEAIDNEQIYPTFIDHGLLRKNEKEKICETFSKKFNNFKCLNAKDKFFSELKGVEDPEKKRKIIGKLFITVFNEYVESLSAKLNIDVLAQGTIYSDLIESGKKSKNSVVIKSHHNVVGHDENSKFKILEPLADLFKDEVKELGEALNVSEWILKQQPFPGPGLAIRIIGEVTEQKIKILQDVDQIYINELEKKGLKNTISQAFAILLSSKSIGIKGDVRSYEYIAALRAVKSDDFMTAETATIKIEDLIDIGTKISNSGMGVCRVVYDLTSKPPGTIEWE